MSEEITVEAKLPQRRTVSYFVSYAHADSKRFVELLTELRSHFRVSKRFSYREWSDEDLSIGKDWNAQIQDALNKADFGLVLVSTNFLGSEYVRTSELPTLLGSKLCLPVALKPIDFNNHDLAGLEKLQIFHLRARGTNKLLAYSECENPEEFVFELFRSIERALREHFDPPLQKPLPQEPPAKPLAYSAPAILPTPANNPPPPILRVEAGSSRPPPELQSGWSPNPFVVIPVSLLALYWTLRLLVPGWELESLIPSWEPEQKSTPVATPPPFQQVLSCQQFFGVTELGAVRLTGLKPEGRFLLRGPLTRLPTHARVYFEAGKKGFETAIIEIVEAKESGLDKNFTDSELLPGQYEFVRSYDEKEVIMGSFWDLSVLGKNATALVQLRKVSSRQP